MDIGFYIADLLRNRDEVSLPGLGTFTKERVPGSYDRVNNSFSPPSYQVSFTNKLSDFDTLSEYVSFKKNLSPSSAEYFVKKFTSGIFDVLQTSGIAEVKPLGIIRQKNENLTFEASANFEIAGKYYGLKPVVDLKKSIEPAITDRIIPSTTTQKGTIEDFITSQLEVETEEEEAHIETPGRSRVLLLIFGAFLLASLVAGLLYFFNPTAQRLVNKVLAKFTSNVAVPESSSRQVPIVTKDSLNAIIPPAIVKDSAIVDSTAKSVSKEKEPKAIVETTTVEIVGAAFGKQSEAENYIKMMSQKGFHPRILEDMPGTLFKVSLQSFPDFPSAQKEYDRIRKEIEPKAWITAYKSKKTQ